MTYTKEQFLKAAELGEVSMIDAKHIVSLLDEVVELPQQNDVEISDEEIDKQAEPIELGVHRMFFKTGAKWYRQQIQSLKQPK